MTPKSPPEPAIFDRRPAIRQAALATFVYVLFCFCLPLIRLPRIHISLGGVLLLVVLPTAAFMYLQTRLSLMLVRVRLLPLAALGCAAVSAAIWFVLSYYVHVRHGIPRTEFLLFVLTQHTLSGLLITFIATFAGSALAVIIRDKNTLMPVALIAMPIDYIGAMTPIGFTNTMIQKHPEIVQAVSVPVPHVGGLGAAALVPLAYIGTGDALFMALYFSAVVKHSLDEKATFQWMFGLLTTAMICVVILPNFNIAALIPMGIAVIVANRKRFTLTRAEIFATIYVGLIVIAGAVAFYVYAHYQLTGGH